MYPKCQLVVLEKKTFCRQVAFWHHSFLSFTLESSKLAFKIENTLGIYFPSVLLSKPVLDVPRAGRLSAPTVSTDTWGVENCLQLWDLHQPEHIQYGQLCYSVQVLCPVCRQAGLRSTVIFSYPPEKDVMWCAQISVYSLILSTLHPRQAQLA